MRRTLRLRAALAPALLAAIACAVGCSKTGDREVEENTEPEFTVTAEALAREYETDSAAADHKYKGKWMLVEGPVQDIEGSPDGDVAVLLKRFVLDPKKNAQGHIVRGEFIPNDQGRLADLTRGQKIVFKGKCQGEDAGTFVDFLACHLEEVGPDPSVPVTAAQLTRDYLKDDKAADAKYKDRFLIVEGTVVAVKEKDKDGGTVLLEGHDEKAPGPVRVAAAFSEYRKKQFVGLKKGDKVKIKGECAGRLVPTEVSIWYSELVY